MGKTEDKKGEIKAEFAELETLLKSYEGENREEQSLDFSASVAVETALFSFSIPRGFQYLCDVDGFEVVCFLEDLQTTPLQVTVKAEPLLLISPKEHKEELQAAIMNAKGMVLDETRVAGEKVLQCHLPTLGGKQMFFALYHETELFSLRLNFVGKISNVAAVTEKILASFQFKSFTPRFNHTAVTALVRVFNRNREEFKKGFAKAEKTEDITTDKAALVRDYIGALWGCLRVLDGEMAKIKDYDVSPQDYDQLLQLGLDFCDDLALCPSAEGEDANSSLVTAARKLVENWRK